MKEVVRIFARICLVLFLSFLILFSLFSIITIIQPVQAESITTDRVANTSWVSDGFSWTKIFTIQQNILTIPKSGDEIWVSSHAKNNHKNRDFDGLQNSGGDHLNSGNNGDEYYYLDDALNKYELEENIGTKTNNASAADPIFTVNTTLDTLDELPGDNICQDSSGLCSIRAAIEEANSIGGLANVILPAGNYVLTLGELSIIDHLFIFGDTSSTTVMDAQGQSRVFAINRPYGNPVVFLSNMTITGGYASQGGGILNRGYLYAEDISIIGNKAIYMGGGVHSSSDDVEAYFYSSEIINNQTLQSTYNQGGGGIFLGNSLGYFEIIETTVVSNTVVGDQGMMGEETGEGGGIYNYYGELSIEHSLILNNHSPTGGGGGIFSVGGTVTATNSSIANNFSLGSGGGVSINQGDMEIENSLLSMNKTQGNGGAMSESGGSTEITIQNSTLSGNMAFSNGGGIYGYSGSVDIINGTVVNNIANYEDQSVYPIKGGGLWINSGILRIKNSILAHNIARSGSSPDCVSFISADYNLIGDATGCSIGGVYDHDILNAEPLLKPLGYYGGETRTVALENNSPAIDAASCTDIEGNVIEIDQRYFEREYDDPTMPDVSGGCDIGAYEFQPMLLLEKTVDDIAPLSGDVITYTISLYNPTVNEFTSTVLLDDLPDGTTLLGPVKLDPIDSGIIDIESPVTVYSMTITPLQSLTVTFPVIINGEVSVGSLITNTAILLVPGIPVWDIFDSSTIVQVSGAKLFLPFVGLK
jgi:uncharacterized repeat protein (TIGR01451 family)